MWNTSQKRLKSSNYNNNQHDDTRLRNLVYNNVNSSQKRLKSSDYNNNQHEDTRLA